jgi:type I restriction enzyme S subunit
MATWSVASYKSALANGRIDAEFFRPVFLEAEAKLTNIDTNVIARHFHISDGNHLEMSRHFTEDEGAVTYYRGQDLNGFFLENAQPMRIPKHIYDRVNMLRSQFMPEDVLICIVGASTGTISLVTANTTPCTGSCKIGIIRRLPSGKVDPFVLAAFLLGKYGQRQVERHSRGTAQGGLILKDIFKLLVPVLPDTEQELIRGLLRGAVSLNARSIALQEEARRLLETELSLDKLTFQKRTYDAQFSTIRLSDTFSAGRVDAQCFAPEALFYENWLNANAKCDHLGSLQKSSAKGRQQPDQANGSTDYCSIKHISGMEIVEASKCSPSADTPLAGLDDLLLAITGATIGKIGIVKRYEQLAFSGDLLCLRIGEKIDPNYLLLVLDHRLGQVQFNRWITGSTNGHLAPRDAERVLVPRLNEDIEAKIAELVRNSLFKRFESEQLLAQAKDRIEQIIEEAVLP